MIKFAPLKVVEIQRLFDSIVREKNWLAGPRINSFKKQTQNSYDPQIDVLILPTPNDSTKVHSDIYINLQSKISYKN